MDFTDCVMTLAFIDVFHAIPDDTVLAYLDPGTGSIIVQVLIAGLCGGLFAIKLFWSKIKTSFNNLSSKGGKAEKK